MLSKDAAVSCRITSLATLRSAGFRPDPPTVGPGTAEAARGLQMNSEFEEAFLLLVALSQIPAGQHQVVGDDLGPLLNAAEAALELNAFPDQRRTPGSLNN